MEKLAALVELVGFTGSRLPDAFSPVACRLQRPSCSNVTFPGSSASANYKSTT